MDRYDIAVLGNGSIGYAIAYELFQNKDDLKLVLVGRQSNFGTASWAAGGMLNLYAELEFDTLEHPILQERFEYAKKAKDLWGTYGSDLNFPVHLGTTIINSNYGTDVDDDNYNAIVDALCEDNVGHEFTNWVPGVDPARKYRTKQYLHIPDEGYIDPLDLKDALEEYLLDKRQTPIWDAHAEKVEKQEDGSFLVTLESGDQFLADKVVVATGAHAGALLEASGVKTQKIAAAVGFGWTIEAPDVKILSVVRSTNRFNACGVTVIPRGNHKYYLGATSEYSPNLDIMFPKIGSLYSIFDQLMKEINPGFATARLLYQHFGERPITEDGLPLLGATSVEGLYVATGTKRDGLFMSPLIARHMAELILDGVNNFPAIFAPEREPLEVMSEYDQENRNARFAKAYEATHTIE